MSIEAPRGNCCARFAGFISSGCLSFWNGLVDLIQRIRNCFCRSAPSEQPAPPPPLTRNRVENLTQPSLQPRSESNDPISPPSLITVHETINNMSPKSSKTEVQHSSNSSNPQLFSTTGESSAEATQSSDAESPPIEYVLKRKFKPELYGLAAMEFFVFLDELDSEFIKAQQPVIIAQMKWLFDCLSDHEKYFVLRTLIVDFSNKLDWATFFVTLYKKIDDSIQVTIHHGLIQELAKDRPLTSMQTIIQLIEKWFTGVDRNLAINNALQRVLETVKDNLSSKSVTNVGNFVQQFVIKTRSGDPADLLPTFSELPGEKEQLTVIQILIGIAGDDERPFFDSKWIVLLMNALPNPIKLKIAKRAFDYAQQTVFPNAQRSDDDIGVLLDKEKRRLFKENSIDFTDQLNLEDIGFIFDFSSLTSS
jgi:hypothetical protein